jgi:hypothetical protein
MIDLRIEASCTATLALLIALGAGCGWAAAQPAAGSPEPGTSPRVVTNEDLPSLDRMDASQARLPEPTAVGSTGPRPIERPEADRQPATSTARPVAEATVPELLAELRQLRKQQMRLKVPFLPRRFADLHPEEGDLETRPSGRVRQESVQARLQEVAEQLRERGETLPNWEFGQPARLIETDIAGGPGVPSERVSETEDAGGEDAQVPYGRWESTRLGTAEGSPRVFYGLDELSETVSTGVIGDGRPAPAYTGDLDEVPVVRPR